MTTDTSERGLERLICTALAGHPCEPPADGHSGRTARRVRRCGLERRQLPRLRPGVLRRSGPARGLPACHAAGGRRRAGAVRGRPDAAQVPGPAPGRDCQARHHRRAAPRPRARAAPPGPVLRHAVGRKREATGTLRAEPFHRHPAATLQPRRDAAGAGHRAVHQRAAGLYLRAEEQPDQADGGRRGLAVQAGSQPAREAVRVRPLRGPLRRGRERGALLHRTSRARRRGSCPSTGAGTTGPATRPTRTDSRPTTCGARC